MTGYTVNTGSNENFAAGWDRVFGGSSNPPAASKAKATNAPSGSQAKAAKQQTRKQLAAEILADQSVPALAEPPLKRKK